MKGANKTEEARKPLLQQAAMRRLSSLLLSCLSRTARHGALLLGLSTLPAGATTEAPSFDYLYIVANEGGSSGGHTAIRFGRDVYHFQNENGLLVLRREHAGDFLYTYTLLENRTVHATRVAVSHQTRSKLSERFAQRHRAQEAQLRVEADLQRDHAMLESLRDAAKTKATQRSSPTIPIVGLGYFDMGHRDPESPVTGSAPSNSPQAGVLVALAAEITRAHGADFLSGRRRELNEAIRRLASEDPTDWQVDEPSSAYAHPAFSTSYSRRWRDLLGGLAALDVLKQARPLDDTAHHAPTDAVFSLDPAETRALDRYAQELAAQLVGLVDSRRTDWGETMLIGMARLSALSRSIDTGQLVFLDTFPASHHTLDEREIGRRVELGSTMLAANRNQLERSMRYFRESGNASELAWERVEERSNRTFEIQRALRQDLPLRISRGHLIPAREAPFPLPSSLLESFETDPDALKRSRQRQLDYSRDLRRIHRYGLIEQNCATAIFETINDSFDDSIELAEEELGGHVRSRHSLSFIPFVSERQVNARYTVVARETIPSYRERRIQTMKDEEPGLRVALRESNTFTSTTYERGSTDSFFIFFTDDKPLLRPILGVVNLTAAIGQSVLGILTAPFDRGTNLLRGLRGTVVSFVELGFANIRKGSNDWIPREYRSLDPIIQESARTP